MGITCTRFVSLTGYLAHGRERTSSTISQTKITKLSYSLTHGLWGLCPGKHWEQLLMQNCYNIITEYLFLINHIFENNLSKNTYTKDIIPIKQLSTHGERLVIHGCCTLRCWGSVAGGLLVVTLKRSTAPAVRWATVTVSPWWFTKRSPYALQMMQRIKPLFITFT